MLPDGVQVEQGLRRMVVLAVTGADDACGRVLRDDVGSAGVLVAHDNAVDLISVEGLNGVDEALALDRGGRGAAKVKTVGRKTLLGELERAAGARRGSLNMLTMVLPLSVGTFLMARSLTSENALAVSRMSLISSSEYSVMSIRCLWLNATVLLTSQRRGATWEPGATSLISTAVWPSTSFIYRCTFSSCDEGTFLPTKSGEMGSSRWPRSTRTASSMRLGRPRSMTASRAARMVRPVYRMSSTSTTRLPSTLKGMLVAWIAGAKLVA